MMCLFFERVWNAIVELQESIPVYGPIPNHGMVLQVRHSALRLSIPPLLPADVPCSIPALFNTFVAT